MANVTGTLHEKSKLEARQLILIKNAEVVNPVAFAALVSREAQLLALEKMPFDYNFLDKENATQLYRDQLLLCAVDEKVKDRIMELYNGFKGPFALE